MKDKKSIRQMMARFIAWLVLFSLVNTMVDTGGFAKDRYLGEDLSVNDMESIYEWVMEGLLDLDNTVPESDEEDIERKPHFQVDWIPASITEAQVALLPAAGLPVLLATALLPTSPMGIISPPPEFLAPGA